MITTTPKVIRLKDAASYLGMDKNRFNVEVRPYLTEIRYGKQCIGFDRQDLDNWLSHYKQQFCKQRSTHRPLKQFKPNSKAKLAIASSKSRFENAVKHSRNQTSPP